MRNKQRQKREQRLATALLMLRRIDDGLVIAKYTGVSDTDPNVETFSTSYGERFGVRSRDGAWDGVVWVEIGGEIPDTDLGAEIEAFRPQIPRVFFKTVWGWPHGPSFPFVTGPLAPPELP